MSTLRQHDLQNRLLSRLPAEDFSLLVGLLSRKECHAAEVITLPDQPIRYVLFPETGIISIVVQTPLGQVAEGGLVGREGFVPSAIMLGADQIPQRIEVQIEGYGHSIETAPFLAAIAKSDGLRMTLLRFTQCLMVQSTFTAASNASHAIEQRLARWLLMCHDRSHDDTLALTHRFMSVMLAVRRASVTIALQSLEDEGLVKAERGCVLVTDRAGLQKFAGDAYGQPESEYLRLLGPF